MVEKSVWCLCEFEELSHTIEKVTSSLGTVFKEHVMRLFCRKCGQEKLVRTLSPKLWYVARERLIGIVAEHLHVLDSEIDEAIAEKVTAMQLVYYEDPRSRAGEYLNLITDLGFSESRARKFGAVVAASVLKKNLGSLYGENEP